MKVFFFYLRIVCQSVFKRGESERLKVFFLLLALFISVILGLQQQMKQTLIFLAVYIVEIFLNILYWRDFYKV